MRSVSQRDTAAGFRVSAWSGSRGVRDLSFTAAEHVGLRARGAPHSSALSLRRSRRRAAMTRPHPGCHRGSAHAPALNASRSRLLRFPLGCNAPHAGLRLVGAGGTCLAIGGWGRRGERVWSSGPDRSAVGTGRVRGGHAGPQDPSRAEPDGVLRVQPLLVAAFEAASSRWRPVQQGQRHHGPCIGGRRRTGGRGNPLPARLEEWP